MRRFELNEVETCPECKGTGHNPLYLSPREKINCLACSGSGELRTPVSLEDALRELGYVKADDRIDKIRDALSQSTQESLLHNLWEALK